MTATLFEEPVDEAPVAVDPPLGGALRGETLAASVVILLVMTVAQRLIGFGRGLLFCRWLEPEELGQWDLAFGFLNLAAPVVVLGLPGSFGRYVEYFRRRGQFHVFLRRTVAVCALASLVAVSAMVTWPNWFGQLIFGDGNAQSAVVWLAACLAIVILHNFLTSLFIAVRMYRIVTLLQFVQSLCFAAISLALLAVWPAGAVSIIAGYAVATLVSAAGSFTWTKQLTETEPADSVPSPPRTFWSKLLPFAMWMWLSNLLANLFEVIDRYMIIHHGGMDATEALRQVGFYHSSRIIPLLFVAVAGLLGSLITPHLSQDWESGRRETVGLRLNLSLKTLLLSLFAASVVTLFVAPFLFNVAFQNKFQGGLEVLPWTLTYCAWFGTTAVAQNYLWCAERPGLTSVALLLGLVLNVACNLVLLPRFGLEGAVWSTTLANLAALGLTYLFSMWQGMRVDAGTWVLTLALASLALGPWISLGVLVVLLLAGATGLAIFSQQERKQLLQATVQGLGRAKHVARRLGLSVSAT